MAKTKNIFQKLKAIWRRAHLPVAMSSWIAHYHAAGISYYHMKKKWDGRFCLLPLTALPQKDDLPLTLIVDPAAFLRRKAQYWVGDKNELMALAEDLFPLPPETTRYAMGVGQDQQPYYYAMPDEDWRALQSKLAHHAESVLIADEQNLRQAIENRLARGGLFDLIAPALRFIHPIWARMATLLAVLVVGMIAGLQLWDYVSAEQEQASQAKLTALEAEAAPLVSQHQAFLKMQAALSQSAEFTKQTEAALVEKLSTLIAALPDEHAIDDISFTQNILVVGGVTRNGVKWPDSLPFDAKLEIIPLPKGDRFVITLAISSS